MENGKLPIEMNNFTQRTLSGAAYVAVTVGAIVWHPIAYGLVFIVISMLAVREFHRLMGSGPESTAIAMAATAFLFAGTWIGIDSEELGMATMLMAIMLFVYAMIVATGLIAELWFKAENPIKNWGTMLISQVMIALPFALMNVIYTADRYLLLAVFVLIWINDSGAYCVGVLTAKRKKGNHKMFERVSPKKSWEGLIGGIVLAIGAGALLARFGWFDAISAGVDKYVAGMLFAMVVALFGTLGDLVESLMKRTIGVKDSGCFLPGHGGVLDRFDSILLAAPASLAMIVIMSLIG